MLLKKGEQETTDPKLSMTKTSNIRETNTNNQQQKTNKQVGHMVDMYTDNYKTHETTQEEQT